MKYWLILSVCTFPCALFGGYHKGMARMRAKDKQGTIQAFKEEVEKTDFIVNAYDYLARIALFYPNSIPEAVAYAEILTLRAPCQLAFHSLADVYNSLGCFNASIQAFRRTLEFEDHGLIRIELFKHYLRQQEYDKAAAISSHELYWHGNFDIQGKKILLIFDTPGHGSGDQLMFLRYARYLKHAGAYVIAKAKQQMKPILITTGYIDEVIVDDTVTDADYTYKNNIACFMLAMQRLPLDTDPYIKADETLEERWRAKLDLKDFKVGLFWQGTYVQTCFGEKLCGARGIALQELQILTDIPEVTFYSLQQLYTFETKEQVCASNIKILDPDIDTEHGSFMETAAIIKQLDLVISCDSSIAHLAGALGIPVWMLLPLESDFRWLLHRQTTFWYQTMHLYRSKELGTWEKTLHKVKDDLIQLVRFKQKEG